MLDEGVRHPPMIARTYIDDSWDGERQIAAVAGGFIGRFGEWCELKKLWNRRLDVDGLKYFRSTEYYSLQGEFRRFRDPIRYPKPKGSEAASKLRNGLDGIIATTGVSGVAVCIPLEEYERARSKDHGTDIFPKDAFEFALQTLMIELAKEFRKQFSGQHGLAFFCDDSPSSERIAKVYAALKTVNALSAEVMGALTHLNDKIYPQVQAADLMAHLARENFHKLLGEGRLRDGIFDVRGISVTRLGESVHFIKCVDREFLEGVLEHEINRRNLRTSVA